MKVLGTVSASNVTATVVASPGPVDAQKTKPTSTDKNATPEAPVAALTLGESVSMVGLVCMFSAGYTPCCISPNTFT